MPEIATILQQRAARVDTSLAHTLHDRGHAYLVLKASGSLSPFANPLKPIHMGTEMRLEIIFSAASHPLMALIGTLIKGDA